MKRYTMVITQTNRSYEETMLPTPDGEWVKYEDVKNNKYEAACKEFLRGCSCALPPRKAEECEECLGVFCDHIRELAKDEGGNGIDMPTIHSTKQCNCAEMVRGRSLEYPPNYIGRKEWIREPHWICPVHGYVKR